MAAKKKTKEYILADGKVHWPFKAKVRLTTRQKSTVQAATKVKNLYHVDIKISLKAETLSQAHEYAARAGMALEDLGATIAVEGEITEINSELFREYNFLSVTSIKDNEISA